MENRRILVIAGSDSSGGAGLEADQKVIAAHKCYAMTATTALTAQNTQGVSDIHHVPAAFVSKQIDICIEDIGVDVVKIGMLASAETVNAVAHALERHSRPTCVLDPVMVATSGSQLLPPDAVTNLRQNLLPLTTILTPNIPEAKLLLTNAGIQVPDISSISDIVCIASLLQGLGSKHVLVKGGHLPLNTQLFPAQNPKDRKFVIDVLHSGTENDVVVFRTEYSETGNTHGTGCSLASAIASNLALGYAMATAVEKACRYVERGIQTAANLGKGSGPINHFHALEVKDYSDGVESSLTRQIWS
ncbi:MAG: hypothetical protein L6R41_005998 [Letrouitia leprolyta]|nr:MAG: hypothetical protein L6R41_005998 [Letrouitia leprolyta]